MTHKAFLKKMADDCHAAKSEFDARFGSEIESYRQAIASAVQSFVSDMRGLVGRLSDNNPVCDSLSQKTGEYLDWLQWTFWGRGYLC